MKAICHHQALSPCMKDFTDGFTAGLKGRQQVDHTNRKRQDSRSRLQLFVVTLEVARVTLKIAM